jgi:hypothetical protein
MVGFFNLLHARESMGGKRMYVEKEETVGCASRGEDGSLRGEAYFPRSERCCCRHQQLGALNFPASLSQVDGSDGPGPPQASELFYLSVCIWDITKGHAGSFIHLLFLNVAFEYFTDHEE